MHISSLRLCELLGSFLNDYLTPSWPGSPIQVLDASYLSYRCGSINSDHAGSYIFVISFGLYYRNFLLFCDNSNISAGVSNPGTLLDLSYSLILIAGSWHAVNARYLVCCEIRWLKRKRKQLSLECLARAPILYL